jgi:hypothetical protein
MLCVCGAGPPDHALEGDHGRLVPVGCRRVKYVAAEFLTGRLLSGSLLNLGFRNARQR